CAQAMEQEQLVLSRLEALPRKLHDLLETFLGAPGGVRGSQELFQQAGRAFKSRFDLEASLAALHREGFLFPAKDKRWAALGSPCYAVPGELVDCVLSHRHRRQSALKDGITLQGFLDARYFRDRNGHADERAAEHARKIYKLYLMDESIATRRKGLPARVRAVVDTVLVRHGGHLPYAELHRELDSEDVPDQDLVKKHLEEAMLGTIASLELARFGIQPAVDAIVVFHEVALQALRQHADANAPSVTETLVCGGDMSTNVARFLRELQHARVQFTADGDLFKASQKRIAGLLLPVAGGFLPGEGLLDWLYRFCLQRRLIDRRGERSLRPTPLGLEFERSELVEQQKQLLAHAVEDRGLPGEHFHQVRLRRVFLRLLRRAEPERWQEIQHLPFLARNAYLAQLDTAQTEGFFAARFQGGGYTPTESLQQMSWNLLLWVKRRLYPLGLVDLGLRDGRPVALRRSRLAADLLDTEPATKVGGTRSSVIVNPDFEILLFPGDDMHAAVHALDRFAQRQKSDHVQVFKLGPETVCAGLADGLTLAQMVQELTDRARAPIPQNVLYSLEEWAGRAEK
ncbi:MAG TPA: helicase-associated domain-containing protein, partial [Planctomycetota bacterium]|nr:helicase-associated domain-containing protein [Planctomycetota bacterium]